MFLVVLESLGEVGFVWVLWGLVVVGWWWFWGVCAKYVQLLSLSGDDLDAFDEWTATIDDIGSHFNLTNREPHLIL